LDGGERHVVGHYRLAQPFQGELSDFFKRRRLFDGDRDGLSNKDLPVLRLGTQTCGEVAHRTDGSVAGAFGEPDLAQVASPCAMPAPNPSNRPRRRQLAVNVPAAPRIATAMLTARSAGSGQGTGSLKNTIMPSPENC
jgi:hypothetical protein